MKDFFFFFRQTSFKKFSPDNFQTAALSSSFIKEMRPTPCLLLCSCGDLYEGPH